MLHINLNSCKHFYGRNTETKRAKSLLRKGQSISIIGPTGIGKTIFICNLVNLLKQIPQYKVVCFDGAAMTSRDEGEIYYLLAKSIQETWKNKISNPKDRSTAYKDLEKTVCKSIDQGFRLVICLDNIDRLVASNDLGREFFSGLRALVTQFGVTFATTSRKSLSKMADQIDCLPFLSLFLPLRLNLLNEMESRGILEEIIKQARFDLLPEATNAIIYFAGGHPSLLHQLARSIIQGHLSQNVFLPESQETAILQSILPHMQKQLQRLWHDLDQEQRCALAYLPYLSNDKRCQITLDQLQSLSLLIKHKQSYTYFSPLLKEFASQQSISPACARYFPSVSRAA